jgi:lipopolysaccharide heptosyltransferase II
MKQPLNNPSTDAVIDWAAVRRVLLIRLRSIGDTVLMTPCLTVLKQARPDLHVTVLLEKLSAPLLSGHRDVDELIVIDRALNQFKNGLQRLRLVRQLRKKRFDVAFNLHGGSTATFLTYLSGAPYRVGYRGFRYSFLLTHRAPDPQEIWQKQDIHSVEQQLGLLRWTGVPVAELPPTALCVSEEALNSITHRLSRAGLRGPFALIHPAATAEEKRWPTLKFAQVVKHLATKHGLPSVVIGARHETHLLDNLKGLAGPSAFTFADLNLTEVVALCALAQLFVGNDSGPAHIAVAMQCSTVVIFGASDHRVWRPWGETPSVIVRAETDFSGRHLEPAERIDYVQVEDVIEAVERLLTTRVTRESQMADSELQI